MSEFNAALELVQLSTLIGFDRAAETLILSISFMFNSIADTLRLIEPLAVGSAVQNYKLGTIHSDQWLTSCTSI